MTIDSAPNYDYFFYFFFFFCGPSQLAIGEKYKEDE